MYRQVDFNRRSSSSVQRKHSPNLPLRNRTHMSNNMYNGNEQNHNSKLSIFRRKPSTSKNISSQDKRLNVKCLSRQHASTKKALNKMYTMDN